MIRATFEKEEPVKDTLREMDAAIRREEAQAALKPILDKMERQEAFLDPETDAIVCIECGMPCYNYIDTMRRAYPVEFGHRAPCICVDCLSGAGHVDK